MARLAVRRMRHADRALLERLLEAAYRHPEQGYGYPRCSNLAELTAEFGVYDLRYEREMRMLDNDGTPVAAFGFLFEPIVTSPRTRRGRVSVAYVVGPYTTGPWRSSSRVASVLDRLESLATRRFERLLLSVREENGRLRNALASRGWTALHSTIELKWMPADLLSTRPTRERKRVGRLAGADDDRSPQAAALLGEAFGWQDTAERRLRDYLVEGYCVGVIEKVGRLVGVAIWGAVKGTDFGRFEYVATERIWRRKGLASALLREALHDLRRAGCHSVFASLDAENIAAASLHLAHGFKETVRSITYEKHF